jgi:multiple sugar transport system permease protein
VGAALLSATTSSMSEISQQRRSWLRPSYAGRRRRDGWLLALPSIILIIALSVYPLIYSLWLAFHQWDLQTPDHPFIWFDNFSEALRDDRLWASLQNTVFIVLVGVTLEFLLGFGLALLLVDSAHLRRFVLPIFILPVMMVPIVVGLTWRMMWDNQYGAVNYFIRIFFGDDVNITWLAQKDTAIIAMIITQLWQWTPFMFVILLAALSSVNPELYEAAALDGASWWRGLRDITIPSISHIIAVALLFRALDAFKIFDLVYMFTQGAPGTSTETVSWYIYRLGNQFFRMGYASAVAYLVLIMLSVVATVYVGRFVREERA